MLDARPPRRSPLLPLSAIAVMLALTLVVVLQMAHDALAGG